tara:strand:- start:3190 stop:3573 length:384 start_codon:yes stop_codon:yes gene_type:complete
MDVKKKLRYLADELLRMKDHEEALRDLGRRNPEQASAIENIFAAFENLDKAKEIDKLMSVVSLIKDNILKSKGYSNFSEEEYQEDKNKIFNIKSKLVSTNTLSKSSMKIVNKIYKKHLGIQKILNSK